MRFKFQDSLERLIEQGRAVKGGIDMKLEARANCLSHLFRGLQIGRLKHYAVKIWEGSQSRDCFIDQLVESQPAL